MALGVAGVQPWFEDPRGLLGDRLRGIYRLLADYGGRIFGDDYFADLYKDSVKGRPTVPARVLATVMILQAHEGLSDREACDRLERDLRRAWVRGEDVGRAVRGAGDRAGVALRRAGRVGLGPRAAAVVGWTGNDGRRIGVAAAGNADAGR